MNPGASGTGAGSAAPPRFRSHEGILGFKRLRPLESGVAAVPGHRPPELARLIRFGLYP
jgi:hypothetical protein